MWKSKRLKQFGGTCGYFALANALNYIAPNDNLLKFKDVEKIIKATIQKGYSNIGEIFRYDAFESIMLEFKNYNKQLCFNYEFVDFNKELVDSLSENQAIVVNYCSFPQERGGAFANSHWVAIVKARKWRFIGKKNKIMIINSSKAKKKKIDEIYVSAAKLQGKQFDWIEFLESKGFKKYYLKNRKINRRLNRYIYQIGIDFKTKMNDEQYQKDHAIIQHDHSKCLLITF